MIQRSVNTVIFPPEDSITTLYLIMVIYELASKLKVHFWMGTGLGSSFNFYTKCAILKIFLQFERKNCNSNMYYLTINACKDVDNSKYGKTYVKYDWVSTTTNGIFHILVNIFSPVSSLFSLFLILVPNSVMAFLAEIFEF